VQLPDIDKPGKKLKEIVVYEVNEVFPDWHFEGVAMAYPNVLRGYRALLN
jgi:hypothetical protein